MVPSNSKTVVLSVNTNTSGVSTLTATVDTKGFSFAKILCLSSSTGTVSTGTNNKIEDADASTGTFATFAGFVQGTDWTGSTSTNSTQNAKVLYNIPLQGRKRYLKVTFTHATAGVGEVLIAELERPSNGISTSTEAFESTDVGNIIGL
jgi:hypothetical protein